MCRYHYINFSNCQHVSICKISYCDKVNFDKAHFGRHSPYHNGADDAPVSGSQHSTSSAEHSSSSGFHISRASHNMYTLVRSGAGHSFADNAAFMKDGEQSPEHAALIPRSAFQESDGTHIQSAVAHVSSLLNADGYHSLNIDIPLDSQSSMSMEASHDVGFENESRTLVKSTRHNFVTDAGTVRASSSPRRPIPAQWFLPISGPNLVTAQRAKERGHKKGSMNGSPIEAKTLSGARSMGDMNKIHGTDGTSFLTKTAHAAIESDLISPPSAKSPTKHQRTLSKPAWNSPTGSSHREGSQQPNFVVKTSPTRSNFVGADAIIAGDGRAATANPVGELVHHDAGKPLMVQTSSRFHTSRRAGAVGQGSKPSLTIEIPPPNARIESGNSSAASPSSGSGSCAIDASPHTPVSATVPSRIPRVATARATSNARGPTRSSTLKRAQSAKSLTFSEVASHGLSPGTHRPQHISPTAGPIRHVRTTNSSGTTPILSRHHTPKRVDHANNTAINTKVGLPSAQPITEEMAQTLGGTHLIAHPYSSADSVCIESKGSRTSSGSTVKAAPTVVDPDVLDSAIIYSKKSGASGTFRDNVYPRSDASTVSAALQDHVESPSPVRGRAEHYVPTVRRQAESEPSLKSSLTSELRATAPDFVPHPPPSGVSDSSKVNPLPQAGSITEFLGPVRYELDMYGLPWAYYMYQMQLAYDQGFRSGRSRSPRKSRQKKHRSSISSPTDTNHVQNGAGQQTSNGKTMPPPMSTVPLAVQRAVQQQHGPIESANEAAETLREGDADAESRSASPFAAQKEMIDRHYAFHNLTVTDRAPRAFDLTTVRNVGLPNGPRNMQLQASLTNTMPNRGRGSYDSHRHFNNRSDNGLYTYHNRGVAGVRMHDTAPFPDPVPPQGRPVGCVAGNDTCEVVDVVYAAERVGGEACYGCEPDHALE